MSDALPPPEDIDPGPPVPEIAALADAPGEGFLARIRRSIERRIGASHLVEFSVTMVLGFLREIGDMLFGVMERPKPARGANEDE